MTPERQKNLDELISALCDEAASPEQIGQLEELLRSDPECRTFYLRYVDLHARLMQHPGFRPLVLADARPVRDPRTPDGSPPASPVLGFLGDLGRRGWGFASGHTTLFSILAALLLVTGLIAVTVWKGNGGTEIANHQAEIPNQNSPFPAPSRVARLTHSVDGCWGHSVPAPELGTAFTAGQKISLCSGAIELDFDVGARAVVQGPAKLDLVAPGKVFLHAGKISAEIVNPEARGFQVETPKGSVVDLGTEFAVDVTPSEDVQVHVFKGEVVVRQPAESPQPPAGPAASDAGQHLLVDQGLRMESGRLRPCLVKDLGETFIRTIDDAYRDRHVVAYWRFEDQPLGTALPDTAGNTRPVRATVDSSFNGNDLYTYSDKTQPEFSPGVPAGVIPQTGSTNRSCLDNSRPCDPQHLRNVYTHSEFSHAAPLDIEKICPRQWTIEASVEPIRHLGAAQTFLGRDTFNGCGKSAGPHSEPPRLAFQIDPQRHFAIAFYDPENRLHQAIAEEPVVEAGRWYHVAATSDGRTLRLYVDALDGRGYRLCATTELPVQGSTALGKGHDDAEWSVCRGRDGASPGQTFEGLIDEVRISDAALSPSQFLFTPKGRGRE